MTAAARVKSTAPDFTTSAFVDVEVDIDASELERAGWVYVGKSEKGHVTTEHVIDTVRRWHDDTHPGPWAWCDHELCDQLRGRGDA